MGVIRNGILALILAAACLQGEEASIPYVYMEYPNAMPGRILKVAKVLDESTGKVELRLEDGSTISSEYLRRLETQEESAKAARRGKLDERLAGKMAEKMAGKRRPEKFKVAISLKHPPISYPDKTRHSQDVLIASSAAAAGIQPQISVSELIVRHGIEGAMALGNSMIVAELAVSQLEELKSDPDIAFIRESTQESPLGPELTSLAASVYNPGSVPSNAGAGVRAATFETGISQNLLNCLGVSAVVWDSYLGWSVESARRHSNATFRVLAAAAPGASLYHRASVNYNTSDDVNFIVNNAIQTTSLSYARGGANPFPSTDPEFLIMDDFAYRYPYPVFVTSAGNFGYQYETNWQNYNAISVGNVRHTNNTTYEMGACTQTKNPAPVYGGGCIAGSGSNCAGDREMPHLVSPGIPAYDTHFATSCLEGSGSVPCGTSWSAPTVNGVAASVISADSRMISWPEKVRAALLLTAQNVDGGYWDRFTDSRDGNGVVSAGEAIAFAQSHVSAAPGSAAVQKGMYATSMYPSAFSGANIRFNYAVPNPKPAGRHLRVVLTWDSNPIVGGGVNALSDLDLVVYSNAAPRHSFSWNSNIEIVDVGAGDLNAGGTYYLEVDPGTNRIPASGARAGFLYYAVAWDWVKD